MDTRTDAASLRPLRPDKKRAARKTAHLTKELLDPYTKRRPHGQKVIWDDEETGLYVLISQGAQAGGHRHVPGLLLSARRSGQAALSEARALS